MKRKFSLSFLFLILMLSPATFPRSTSKGLDRELNLSQKVDLVYYNTLRNLDHIDTRKEKIDSLIEGLFEIKKISEDFRLTQNKKEKKLIRYRLSSLEEILKKEIKTGLM